MQRLSRSAMASRLAALRGDFDSAKSAGPSDKAIRFGRLHRPGHFSLQEGDIWEYVVRSRLRFFVMVG